MFTSNEYLDIAKFQCLTLFYSSMISVQISEIEAVNYCNTQTFNQDLENQPSEKVREFKRNLTMFKIAPVKIDEMLYQTLQGTLGSCERCSLTTLL